MSKTKTTLIAAVTLASLMQPASAGLFGPGTEILQGPALAQMLQSQPVVVSVSGGPLDVRSKAAAVGGFLLGFVASSVMASGGMRPGMNAQQMNQTMQANLQIATAFNQNIQSTVTRMAADQAAKSTTQVAKEGPLGPISQQLIPALAQTPGLMLAPTAEGTQADPAYLQLRLTQPEWQLDFSMASNDYTLLHQIELTLYQKSTDKIFFKETCKTEYAKKMPKEDWERDDYAAVATASNELASQCADKLVAALGIGALPQTMAVSPKAAGATPAPATEAQAPAEEVDRTENAAPVEPAQNTAPAEAN